MIRLRQIKKSFQDKSGINEVLRGIDLDVIDGSANGAPCVHNGILNLAICN